MISWTFNTLVFHPLYNLFVLLMDIPYIDAGLAVILFTLLVRSILIPLSKQAEATQIKMQKIQPEYDALKEKYKDNKETLALEMMKLYKENKINPFAGFILILIQLPILIALYWIFYNTGLPNIKLEILYSFIPSPSNVSPFLFGFIDITLAKNLVLALLAAALQILHVQIAMPKQKNLSQPGTSMKDDFVRSMRIQSIFITPIITFFIAYNLPAVISIYFITGSLFSIFQSLYIKKAIYKEPVKS